MRSRPRTRVTARTRMRVTARTRARMRRSPMDIDLSVLRSLEAEKDISMDLAIKAIEDALLVAYHRSDGVAATARVEVNKSSGHVTVWAAETGEDGQIIR